MARRERTERWKTKIIPLHEHLIPWKSLDGSAILPTNENLLLDMNSALLGMSWISSTDNKTICSSQHSMCADNDIKSAFCLLVGDENDSSLGMNGFSVPQRFYHTFMM